MSHKTLVFSGGTIIVTIFFVIAYVSFNVLNITQTKLKKYELTLVSESAEKVYDGEPLSNLNWYIEDGKLDEGDVLEINMPSSITNPGTIENEIGVTITDVDGVNITTNYEITYKLGDLTVHPRAITIETESLEKVYDGLPLSSQSWMLTDGILLSNHRIEYTMTQSITTPGSITNDVGITIVDENNQIVTDRYDIDFILGELTVHKREIFISTESLEKVYDGQPLSSEQWRLTRGVLIESHRMDVVMNSSITNPGSIINDVGITIFNDKNLIVTPYYEIVYDYG